MLEMSLPIWHQSLLHYIGCYGICRLIPNHQLIDFGISLVPFEMSKFLVFYMSDCQYSGCNFIRAMFSKEGLTSQYLPLTVPDRLDSPLRKNPYLQVLDLFISYFSRDLRLSYTRIWCDFDYKDGGVCSERCENEGYRIIFKQKTLCVYL